ncbi:hypothetical protein [Haloferula sp. BvORR071]|uniref:hypothetical protein n=1 Tax=Haloferula sp. BvORR071 TaxID=1396141 RepID=UPI0005525948|nr:hypothetical protein [Haloferula sp. BvORR071]
MMRKIFDRFLDKPDPLAGILSAKFGVAIGDFVAVRIVSHHMRLLGVMVKREGISNLALVDYDDTKD